MQQSDDNNKNEFFTYPLFNKDSNKYRQTFNRFKVLKTILHDHGKNMFKDYMKQFDKKSVLYIKTLCASISCYGEEEALLKWKTQGGF